MKNGLLSGLINIGAIAFVAMSLLYASQVSISAQTDEVSIWRLELDEPLLNRNLTIGGSNDDTITYKSNGITVVRHWWESSDEGVFRIEDNDGESETIGVGEGLAKLFLWVEATDGNTYRDYAYISVYRQFDSSFDAEITNNTKVYRHSGDDSDYRNERGIIPAGTSISVVGVSGDFYRINWEGFSFDDNVSNKGYVRREDVSIPITEIGFDPKDIAVRKGNAKSIKDHMTIIP